MLACGTEREPTAVEVAEPTAAAHETQPLFEDIAEAAGVHFVHHNGAEGRFYYPELMTGGGGMLDFDADGALDLYLVQAGSLTQQGTSPHHNHLYRNQGDGTFEDVTEAAGVGDAGYGIGMAAGDYDGDGWVDIYVTNLGANVLYRNNGDGTFKDVSDRAGVGDTGYASSATFADIDGDRDLDLFVANYVDWSPQAENRCIGRNGSHGYCSPSEYAPLADTLFRNDGNGTFTDISDSAGIGGVPGPGLGVTAADFDGDGRVDIYVANDQAANHLWINLGDGRFAEEALVRGAGLNEIGDPEAGMGVMAADPDADGDWDLFLVHLTGETNTFYRNEGGHFRDVTDELRLGSVSQPYTGFGAGLFDFDNDGRSDIFIANGKVTPGESSIVDYGEPNQLLRGMPDGSFEEVPAGQIAARRTAEVSRAAAFGDIDDDGDVDILVVNNGGPARLLRNDVDTGNHWLAIDLCGRDGTDRSATGSRVSVNVGTLEQHKQVQPGYSFASSSDSRLHFGLGEATRVDLVTVVWPDGTTVELHDVDADQILSIAEDGECRGQA